MNQRIGIVGVPPLAIIEAITREGDILIDLDEPQIQASLDQSASQIPRVYCAILRTVVLNCMHLSLDRVYIDVGPGKCDCALHTAEVLDDMLPVPVLRTRNQDVRAFGYPLCISRLPLLEKFRRITKGVQSPQPYPLMARCEPECGFWGVPPRDFSLLSLFPDTTHVFGWTRCMENKTPADLDLERAFDPSIPTVFFSQSFCAKAALAKHLAAKHPRGIAIDCDVTAGSSTRAKIEAFLELSGIEPGNRKVD